MSRTLDEIYALFTVGRQTVIDAGSFDGAAETLALLGSSTLTVEVTGLDPADAQQAKARGSVTVAGTALLFGLDGVAVRLQVGGDGGSRVRLDVDAGDRWHFATAFKVLPPSFKHIDGNPGLVSLQPSILADLVFKTATLTARNAADADGPAGLWFSGALATNDVFGSFAGVLALGPTPTLAGSIVAGADAPHVDFAVKSGVSALTVGGALQITNPHVLLRTVIEDDETDPVTALAFAAGVAVGDGDPVEISGTFYPLSPILALAALFPEGRVTLDRGLSAVASLAGLNVGDLTLPKEIDIVGSAALREITADFDPSVGGYVRHLQFAIELPRDRSWTIVDGLSVGEIGIDCMVRFPFAPDFRSITICVYGVLALGRDSHVVRFDVSADNDQDFTIEGVLHAGDSINLAALVGAALGHDLDEPALNVTALWIEAGSDGHFALDARLDAWGLSLPVAALSLDQVSAVLTRDQGGARSGRLTAILTLGGVSLYVGAEVPAPGEGFTFKGGTWGDTQIDLTKVAADVVSHFGVSLPEGLPSFVLGKLNVVFESKRKHFTFYAATSFNVRGRDIPLVLQFDIVPTNGHYATTAKAQLTVPAQTFEADFTSAKAGTSVTFEWLDAGGPLSFHDLAEVLGFGDMPALPESLDLALTRARFHYNFSDKTLAIDASSKNYGDLAFYSYEKAHDPDSRVYVVALELPFPTNLSELPVVGNQLPSSVGISDMQLVFASADLAGGDLAGVAAGLVAIGDKTLLPTMLSRGFTLAANLHAAGETRALVLPLKTKTPQRTTATPSPRHAAEHGTQLPVASVSVPSMADGDASGAGHGGGPLWFNVDKSVGAVTLSRIGLAYEEGVLSLLFDAALALGGVELGLDGLGFGSPLSRLDPSVSLSGLSISYNKGPLSIGGAFLRAGDDGYFGTLLAHSATFSFQALGGYAPAAHGDPASFFIYANVHVPLGGPPFLYVTGLAGGLGIDRTLRLPHLDGLSRYPLLPKNAPAEHGSAKDTIQQALPALEGIFTKAPGEYWLAAGITFTSFEMVEAFALVTVSFGVDFEIGLLGSCAMTFPKGSESSTIAYVEVDLVASVHPSTGLMAVYGKLSPASNIFGGFAQIAGGFAYALWFDGDRKGDFVVSMGGYSPFGSFSRYPAVPRVTLSLGLGPFQASGQCYYALTPAMMMAGMSVSATHSAGPVSAWMDAGIDVLMAWAPFHYEAHGYVHIGASVDLGLFTIHVHAGADLYIWGPPFGGTASVDLDVVSFDIDFGAARAPPPAIDWNAFRTGFLPKDTPAPPAHAMVREVVAGRLAETAPVRGNIVTASVQTGLASTHASGVDWIIDAEHFVILTNGLPANAAEWRTDSDHVASLPDARTGYDLDLHQVDFDKGPDLVLAADAKTIDADHVWNPVLNVAPMNKSGVRSWHRIELQRLAQNKPDYITGVCAEPVLSDVGSALWGLFNPNPGANDQSLLQSALTGFRITPVPRHPMKTSEVRLFDLAFDPGEEAEMVFGTPLAASDVSVSSRDDDAGRLTVTIEPRGGASRSLDAAGYAIGPLLDDARERRAALATDLAAHGFTVPSAIVLDAFAKKALTGWPGVGLLGADIGG